MKRLLCVFLGVCFLFGCAGKDHLDPIMELRSRLLAENCRFQATITADYGARFYQFSLCCESDVAGRLKFSVVDPESIAGIGGTISATGGKLEFDDTALAFPLLADGLLSPISGPYILMKALRGGYISSAGKDGSFCRVSLRDSYEEDAYSLDVWLDENNTPVRAEILWDNRRILTLQLENFQIG